MPVVTLIDASGASTVRLDSGFSSANGLTVILTGASECELATVVCEAWVDVGPRPVDLSASGGFTFYYGGTPALSAPNISGGSRMMRVR